MNIGIVGNEGAKFTPETKRKAEAHIQHILSEEAGVLWGETWRPKTEAVTMVSGHCHLGGIDIWAEEVADFIGTKKLIFPPKNLTWAGGFKPRNIQIAENSDKVYCILVKELPPTYTGMTFKDCYHCTRRYKSQFLNPLAIGFEQPHIKSGACWTAWYAIEKLNKPAEWIII